MEGKGDTAVECQENVLLLIFLAVMILCILNVFFRVGGWGEDRRYSGYALPSPSD